MEQTNSKIYRESDSLLDANNDNYGTTEPVNDTTNGTSWDQLRPIGSEEETIISRDVINNIVNYIVDTDTGPPYDLSYLPNMNIDEMDDKDREKLYANIDFAMYNSMFTSMKRMQCEISQKSVADDKGIYIVQPQVAADTYCSFHCEGDIGLDEIVYNQLYKDKRFLKAMNINYMKHKKVYFRWQLTEHELEYIKVERTNGNIEDNWKIDESKCLVIENRSKGRDICVYCYQDNDDKLPRKSIALKDIIILNPHIKVTIKEPVPEMTEKHILCDKVIEDGRKIYEEFKSYV